MSPTNWGARTRFRAGECRIRLEGVVGAACPVVKRQSGGEGAAPMRGKCSNSISRWRRGHSNGVAAECSRYKVSSTWSQTWQCRRRTIRRHASRSPGIAVEGNGPSMTLATVGGIGRDAAGSSALPDVDQWSHLYAIAVTELNQIQNLRPPPYGGRGHPDRHGRDLPRWIARSCSRQEALLLRFGFGHAYFHGNELGASSGEGRRSDHPEQCPSGRVDPQYFPSLWALLSRAARTWANES